MTEYEMFVSIMKPKADTWDEQIHDDFIHIVCSPNAGFEMGYMMMYVLLKFQISSGKLVAFGAAE